MKKIAVLGSTGSIGTQTLEIVRERNGEFEIVALSAGSNIDLLERQVVEDTIISPGTVKHSVVLSGYGVQSYDLYINNQFYKTIKVDFEAND